MAGRELEFGAIREHDPFYFVVGGAKDFGNAEWSAAIEGELANFV